MSGEEEAAEARDVGEDPEVEDPEVEEAEDVEDWADDEEDWGAVGPSLGFWEGDAFRLEQFLADPSTWSEGDVDVAQTMGTLDLVYYLPEELSHFTHEDLQVEVAGWRTRVTFPSGLPGKRSWAEVGSLSGNLLHSVRPRLSVWRLLQENGQACLHLHLAKLDHRPWKGLWATGNECVFQGRKHRFHWQARGEQGPDAYAHQQLYVVPHETPPPPVETDYRLDPVALCLGMDDVEEHDDHAILRLHFSRSELERLEAVMPLEDVLTADVQERHLRVFLRVSGEDGKEELEVFEGELHGRCVPELTAWQLVRAAKGDPKGKGEAFNPALEFALSKHPEDQQGRWGRIFDRATHAETLALERSRPGDRAYRRADAQLQMRLAELLGPSGAEKEAEPAAPGRPWPPSAARLQEDAAQAAAARAPAPEEAPREFLIDNSELQANTKGLGYRLSRHLQDKDRDELAEWGTTVLGVDMGDGWVRVGRRYLPTTLNGKAVLTGDVIGLPRPSAPSYV